MNIKRSYNDKRTDKIDWVWTNPDILNLSQTRENIQRLINENNPLMNCMHFFNYYNDHMKVSETLDYIFSKLGMPDDDVHQWKQGNFSSEYNNILDLAIELELVEITWNYVLGDIPINNEDSLMLLYHCMEALKAADEDAFDEFSEDYDMTKFFENYYQKK